MHCCWNFDHMKFPISICASIHEPNCYILNRRRKRAEGRNTARAESTRNAVFSFLQKYVCVHVTSPYHYWRNNVVDRRTCNIGRSLLNAHTHMRSKCVPWINVHSEHTKRGFIVQNFLADIARRLPSRTNWTQWRPQQSSSCCWRTGTIQHQKPADWTSWRKSAAPHSTASHRSWSQ